MKVCIILVFLLTLLLGAVTTHAQSTEWETLNNEMAALYQQGKYDEGHH